MTKTASILKKGVAAASMAALLSAGFATTASAQTGGGIGSVANCDAVGGKQEAGAVIGGLLGALAGNQLAKNERTLGTVAGGALGAAAGSWTGCKMQRDAAARGERPYKGQTSGSYVAGGQRLATYVQPASFSRLGGDFYATSSLNLRAGPSTRAAKVGALARGERFQALAQANGGSWILVGQNGVGVGYVAADFIRPAGGHRYAASY
jgi:hypothetical protein